MTWLRRVPLWAKIVTIAFVVLAGVGIFLTSWVANDIFKTTVLEDIEAPKLEAWIGLDFPDSLSGLRSHAEGWQDYQVFVRFEMPTRELEGFLKRNTLEPTPNLVYALENTSLEKAWWKPEALKQATMYHLKSSSDTVQPSTKTFFYPTVVIGPSTGDSVTVYVYAFNT